MVIMSRPSDWWAVQSESSKQAGDNDNSEQKAQSTRTHNTYKSQHHEDHQGKNDSSGVSIFVPKNINIIKNKKKINGPLNSKRAKQTKKAKLNRAVSDQIRKTSEEDSDHRPISKRRKTTSVVSSEEIENQPNARTRKIDNFSEQNLGNLTDIENSEDELKFQSQTNYEFNEQDSKYLSTTVNRTGNENNLNRISELDINSSDSEQSSYTSILEIENRENHIEDFENNDTLPFEKLATITKPVSRHVIESKWNALPPNCVECVAKQLQDIQIPIITSFNDSRRRKQASKALKSISLDIIRRISKDILFPLGTRRNRKIDLDFKRISHYNKSLESQLTPVLHANSLLNTALSQELDYLRIEKRILVDLETNAKKEMSLRSESAKKLHPLFQSGYKNNSIYSLKEDIGLEFGYADIPKPRSVNATQYDQNLSTVIQNIQYHVTSIRNNVHQLHDVSETISRTKANLQSTLFNHLDNIEYQEIFLGTD
ncbi:hypothetical protein OnM2_024037 [Erysiphe neolycopersici]|uniref:Kinetochore protein fta7 n=1 Tax=Erysiphe neolycopersici TaxID=212602 RepID=A0A420I1R1_9PEZI|nr:hypothetical protein OnM2_024037 [Erysiphe neolycopersici]